MVLEQFLLHPIIGGFGILSFIVMNFWAYRVIRAFQRETRDDYRTRLQDAQSENENLKARILRLELKIQSLDHVIKNKLNV